MTPNKLYRYLDDMGRTINSPIEPKDKEYSLRIRLVAGKGMVLSNDGINFCTCIDIDSVDGWYEIEAPANYNLYPEEDVTEENRGE